MGAYKDNRFQRRNKTAIVSDEDTIIVSDYNNNRISEFSFNVHSYGTSWLNQMVLTTQTLFPTITHIYGLLKVILHINPKDTICTG